MRNKGSLIEEPLFFECLQQTLAHGFIVLAGVADVGEDLGEGFFVVDAQELEVLGQVLLVIIVLVDVDAQAADRRGEAARRAICLPTARRCVCGSYRLSERLRVKNQLLSCWLYTFDGTY